MLIDWFTVGAQALNFIILVWLLKRFLYKPILNAIDAREKLIAAKLADAAAKEAEAQKERDEFQHKNEAFDKQRAALMSEATDEATAEGHKLLDEARNAANALSAKRQETLRSDAHSLNQALRRRTQQEVFAIARRTLTDLAGASLEERVGDVFIHRLRAMDGKVKETFALALETASGPALVRSAFDLPDKQRAAIQKSFDDTFSTQIQIRFETAPDLVSGIELSANGQKLAWSIADYLASLEKGVGDLLKEHDSPQPTSESKPAGTPAAKARVAANAKAKSRSKPKEPKLKAARQ
jgi:F-type H+-transporting ATPase subunit b